MEDAGKNAFKGSVTGLNLRYISSKTDDFSQRPPLSVEASFSYVGNSEKSLNKIRKTSGSPQQQERPRSSTSLQHGISSSQRANGFVDGPRKTSPTRDGKAKNGLDKEKQEIKTDLLLQGKRLQLTPEFWSPSEFALHKRSSSEPEYKSLESNEEFRRSSGVQTYPLSSARSSYPSGLNSRHLHDSGNFLNHHRLPAFCPRPLGQSWVGGTERQRSHGGEFRRPPDDIHASGVRHPLCTRQGGQPRRYTPSPRLRRVGSQDSLRNYIPRSRSSSLPVSTKPHESRVVMDWKEKRTGGVTYVTHFLQTSSDENLSSYSHEQDGTSRLTEQYYHGDNSS